MAYNVCVVTGTRAEYGLLRPVIEKINSHEGMKLSLVVTGSHLSAGFGNTVSEIEEDGYTPSAKIDILSGGEGGNARSLTAMRTARAVDAFCRYFASARPDVVLVLGDRYEIFAAGQAAALLDIPLAHISGGDVTFGADDDWFRHCLTKMARLHFPSCEEYRQRVIRMGEAPHTVHNVGGLGDENIRSMRLLALSGLEESLGHSLGGAYALVTCHPETQSALAPKQQAQRLLDAMDENPGLFYLITKANADAGGTVMNRMVEGYCKNRGNAVVHASLGALRYLSAMKHARLVLGNSSSGIAETPSLKVPCVNIGERQTGRVRCANIIDCPFGTREISLAIQKAATPEFAKVCENVQSPYNGGDTSGRIVEILYGALSSGSISGPKLFYDNI